MPRKTPDLRRIAAVNTTTNTFTVVRGVNGTAATAKEVSGKLLTPPSSPHTCCSSHSPE
jgi:hypothetical protein